jgi:hypothetical protein
MSSLSTLPLPSNSPFPSGLVPFHALPSCVFKHCVEETTSTLLCSTPFIPRPTSSGTNIPTVEKACYCSLPHPLSCAWAKCKPMDWLLAEDWYSSACPNVQPVDFTPLPVCAQSCLQESTFDHTCITFQRNCFCSLENLFGCLAMCDAAANNSVVEWYSHQCGVSTQRALQVAMVVNWTVLGVLSQPPPAYRLAWYEAFTVVVLAISALAFLVHVLWLREFMLKSQDRALHNKKTVSS